MSSLFEYPFLFHVSVHKKKKATVLDKEERAFVTSGRGAGRSITSVEEWLPERENQSACSKILFDCISDYVVLKCVRTYYVSFYIRNLGLIIIWRDIIIRI